MSNSIQQALRNSRNITSLYTHQAASINALQRNKHVIVSTSTASGKSIIYQVRIYFYRCTMAGMIETLVGTIIAIPRRRYRLYGNVHISHQGQSVCDHTAKY